uniref:Uncharacterized protein n=1 Tax=Triticum urartu TaxID=4572 RepID=A0A8R7UZ03_TRIUA
MLATEHPAPGTHVLSPLEGVLGLLELGAETLALLSCRYLTLVGAALTFIFCRELVLVSGLLTLISCRELALAGVVLAPISCGELALAGVVLLTEHPTPSAHVPSPLEGVLGLLELCADAAALISYGELAPADHDEERLATACRHPLTLYSLDLAHTLTKSLSSLTDLILTMTVINLLTIYREQFLGCKLIS